MGGVFQEFQIVVVQLFAETEDKGYIECWGVELNGLKENCINFYLKCYSAYPSIIVGRDNVVTFDCVQPKCQDIQQVAIRNNSVHQLQ